jgi:hypothetical protein
MKFLLRNSPWKIGDVVRVVHHSFEPRAIGLVFKIHRFSSMDFSGHCPVVRNPWHDPTDSDWKSAILLRFDPDWLVEATILDHLAMI